MKTKLIKIAEIAFKKPKEKFTSLYHLINEEMLIQCHKELKGKKASGIDKITKEEYEDTLSENINCLVKRLKSRKYRPQPVKRVYIPKDNGKNRPLGMPTYEDKLVQMALNKILQSIYERDFMSMSFGFRANKNCHDALKLVNKEIVEKRINYIVDADIKSFFDNVNHKWLIEFLKVRIADKNIIGLVNKFLRAGIMENGIKLESDKGTPQGGLCRARHNPPYVELDIMPS